MPEYIGDTVHFTAVKIVLDMIKNPKAKGMIFSDKEFSEKVQAEVKRLLAFMGMEESEKG